MTTEQYPPPVDKGEVIAYAVYDIKYGGSQSLHWAHQHTNDGDTDSFKVVPLVAGDAVPVSTSNSAGLLTSLGLWGGGKQIHRKETAMLSDEEITHGQKCLQIWQRFTSLPMVSHHVEFAKAIETEAHKQDTKLIQQMFDALNAPYDGAKLHALQTAAIESARKRLRNT